MEQGRSIGYDKANLQKGVMQIDYKGDFGLAETDGPRRRRRGRWYFWGLRAHSAGSGI